MNFTKLVYTLPVFKKESVCCVLVILYFKYVQIVFFTDFFIKIIVNSIGLGCVQISVYIKIFFKGFSQLCVVQVVSFFGEEDEVFTDTNAIGCKHGLFVACKKGQRKSQKQHDS